MMMAIMLLLVNSVYATKTVTAISATTATEDTAYTGTLTETGTENGTSAYALNGAPTWLSISATTGALSGTPLQANIGANSFSINVTDLDGTTTSASLTITVSATNDAPTVDVSGCTATQGVEDVAYTCTVSATDEEDGTLTSSLTSTTDGVTITAGSLTWTPDDEQIGSNTVNVNVEDGNSTPGTASFTVFVRSDDVCGDFESGSDLSITDWDITDDDEDFYPGDKIEMEVEVENDGDEDLEDIEIEAILYDTTDGKRLDVVKSDDFNLDEDEDDKIELLLEIPEDVDTDNDLIVFVSAYEDGNDDENCDWEKEDGLDFKRRKHDVTIDKVVLSTSTVKAGRSVDVKVDLENVGDRDEEDAYVKVKNGELSIDERSELFDIDAYENGDDDEYSVTITVDIPADADDGNYDLEVQVYDDDDEIYESGEKFITLSVEGTTSTTTTTTTTTTATGTVTVSTEGTPEEAKKGTSFSIPVKLTNTASETKEYKITISNIADWAGTTPEIEAYLTAGQSSTFHVTITPEEDAAEGKHSATVNVKEGSTLIATKTLSFTIPETTTTNSITGGAVIDVPETEDGKGFFNNLFSGTTLWIIGDLVLVLVAIFFIKMLFSKRS